jgi:heme exporter protein C
MRRFANPARFMRFSGQLLPWVAWPTALLLGAGLMRALFVAPRD